MPSGNLNKTAADLFGVPATARNARDRLLLKAIDLFYANGFNAVGLDRLLSEVGVTKTTFYKHFDSKDDLIVAALVKRDEWENQAWVRAVKQIGGDDPRAQLLAFLDVLDVWFNDPSFGGCLFLNAAAEFPNPYDPVHQAAASHKRKSRDQYRDLAQAAGAENSEGFADLFALLIEGTLIMRHVYGRNDAARIAKQQAERLLEEHLPVADARKRRTQSTRRPAPRRRRKAPLPGRV